MRNQLILFFLFGLSVTIHTSNPVSAAWGLKPGTPSVRSAGPMTFGPDGILFLGDTKSATVFAIQTGESSQPSGSVEIDVQEVDQKIAKALELSSPDDIEINDLAVNPNTGTTYISVSCRKGEKAKPAIVRVMGNGSVSKFSWENVEYSQVVLPDAPEDKVAGEGRRRRNRRDSSITDVAFAESKVLVSGLSAGDSPSSVREIFFPFAEADSGTRVEIYHGAHGRYEDQRAPSTFVPININGEPNVLAAYVCTPLVRFPLNEMKSGERFRGTTVAELGNRNRPLDMIVYEKDGQQFLLLSNSARGVMKISTNAIGRKEGITQRVPGGGTEGQQYETIAEFEGVEQMDRLDENDAVILAKTESGARNLYTVPLP